MSELPPPADDAPTVVSTFTGAGGACLGYKMAGYRTLLACEFIEEARTTYNANFPGVPVLPHDIRNVNADDITKYGVPDVIEGSPPCSSFSMAGKRQKGWGETKQYSDHAVQRTDDLFWEFARLVRDVQPKVFTAENVPGMIAGAAKGYFIEIRELLRSAGYRVEASVLDAQWLGVPQRRKRLIFVGVREDLNDKETGKPLQPAFPKPLDYRYTLADILGHVVLHDTSGKFSLGDVTDGPSPTITVGSKGNASRQYQVLTRLDRDGNIGEMDLDEPAPTVMGFGIGGSGRAQTMIIDPWGDDGTATDPETGYRIDLHGTALYQDWLRQHRGEPFRYINSSAAEADSPSGTITATGNRRGTAGVMLAASPRKFTLQELRRICSFPDDFVLTGTYPQRWERLGRAVPPLMSKAIASTVRTEILDRI